MRTNTNSYDRTFRQQSTQLDSKDNSIQFVKSGVYSIIESEVDMHFAVVKSRTIKIVIAMIIVCALLAATFSGAHLAEVFFGYSTRLVPIYNVETDEKKVAISFDAAWGADKTEGILDILKEYDVKATFFLVGFWVDEYPDTVKKIDEAGIEIGTHSNKHPDMVKLSRENIAQELTTSISKIEAITNKKVKLFRPPFGSYNNTLIEESEKLGLKTIQWDVDTLDWKGLSGSEMCKRVTNKVKNGSIILMHNNSDNILDGLRQILDRLKMQGYEVTSVGNLVYESDYSIDRNGVQHKN